MRKLILFLVTSIIIRVSYANTIMVDVFANVDESVSDTIQNINTSFESSGLYNKYGISPLINTHKVHMTMYLTEYDESKIAEIKNVVARVTQTTNSFTIADSAISLKASNFLMLDIQNNLQLQTLSDKLTANLMQLRNKNAAIPAWAKSDPVKSVMFSQYGSPNVFEGFSPHFSFFVAKIAAESQIQFSQDVNKQIEQFALKTHNYKVTGLGIGITDTNGQIVQLIAEYKFR